MRTETRAALQAVATAQRIADTRTGASQITSKGGIDLVTATDIACEDAIRAELGKAFPNYAIVGEERGGIAKDGVPYWLVDPICGTRPYASDIPLYCTNLALVENGEVTIAVVGIGKSREIVFAEKGKGVTLRNEEGDRSVFASDRSNTVWIDGRTPSFANGFQNVLEQRRWYVWSFSSTVAYAYLACGRIAGIIQFGSGVQDTDRTGSVHTAPGCFLARESGAVVTALHSSREWGLPMRSHLIAATPSMHQELQALIANSQ